MSPLEEALQDYLALRRALGYKLARSELLLAQFVAYLEAEGAPTITTDHALAWATLPDRSRSWSAIRMSAVRGFARYLHTRDPSCEVPPSDILRPRPRSRVPFLYSREQLGELLAATGTLSSPLRAATFRTLICLLVATGIRISEAIGLDREDLDTDDGLLLIRHGKFGKQRLLPLHDTARDALASYLDRPDRRQRPDCPALLVSSAGTRLLYPNINRTFRTLTARAGVSARSARCTPRIHDLRHTFAVETVLDCYRTGADLDARLPLLSTYLGHVNPANTYWYLTGSPELLALAGERLEASLGGRS